MRGEEEDGRAFAAACGEENERSALELTNSTERCNTVEDMTGGDEHLTSKKNKKKKKKKKKKEEKERLKEVERLKEENRLLKERVKELEQKVEHLQQHVAFYEILTTPREARVDMQKRSASSSPSSSPSLTRLSAVSVAATDTLEADTNDPSRMANGDEKGVHDDNEKNDDERTADLSSTAAIKSSSIDSEDEIDPYPFDECDTEANIMYKEISKKGLGRHRGVSLGEGSALQSLSESRKIKAGTLHKLVEKVTDHKELGFSSPVLNPHLSQFPNLKQTDPSFLRAFLLTYRSFSTPEELLELLIKRYPLILLLLLLSKFGVRWFLDS